MRNIMAALYAVSKQLNVESEVSPRVDTCPHRGVIGAEVLTQCLRVSVHVCACVRAVCVCVCVCVRLQVKLEEALTVATDFHDSLQDFINWLTQAEQTLTMVSPASLIMDTVMFQIDEHKVRPASRRTAPPPGER